MLKLTEKCFYTILITTLIIVAILVPIIVIQIDQNTSTKRAYLSPRNEKDPPNEENDGPNQKYYTPSELSNFLDEFSAQRSFIFTSTEIGTTDRKNSIKEVVLQNRALNNPVILTVSGLLARDWLSVYITIEIMNKFFADVHLTNRLLYKYSFRFLPLMNPDGYELSHSLPIYSNWGKTFDSFKRGKPSGVDILHDFGNGGNASEEANIFKDYFSKSKHNIKAVFLLFSPKELNFTSGFYTISHGHGNATKEESLLDHLGDSIEKERHTFFKYVDAGRAPPSRIDGFILNKKKAIRVVNAMANFRATAPELLQVKSKVVSTKVDFFLKLTLLTLSF